jgi:hypothetical protein
MIDSSRLIEQQLRLVELKRSLESSPRAAAASGLGTGVPYGPCLLISRQYGSLGDQHARQLGETLQWHVFDREIVEQIADRAHVRNQLVESVDEKVRSRWQILLHPLRERHTLKPKTYLLYLHEILLSLGHHGYVVIVGRGAQYLLPAACAVRVRVVESVDSRVRQVATAQQCSRDDAQKIVARADAASSAFVRDIFHQDSASLLDYDLVLNTGLLRLDAAMHLVLGALKNKLGVQAEPIPCAT